MSTKNNKMTTKNGLATKTITKYYFVVKSIQNTWVPILSPFVMSSPNSTAGEFLSSSWYKNAIPEEYECAVIRITIDATDEKKRVVADAMCILDCVAIMNDAEDDTMGELDFVIMHHVMKKNICFRFIDVCENYLRIIIVILPQHMRLCKLPPELLECHLP